MPESFSVSSQFDTTAVSSLPQVIAERNGPLSLVAAGHLPLWLPELKIPEGWILAGSGGTPTTRMMLRRLNIASNWDGCEVINLYRVPGVVPQEVVFANADKALRECGARNIHSAGIDTPPSYRTITVRVTGDLIVEARPLWAQYTYYVVESAAGTALIEQVIMVGLDAVERLRPDVETLTGDLYRSLLNSIERGQAAHDGSAPQGAVTDSLRGSYVDGAPTTKVASMSVIRVNYVTDFYYGAPAVVVTLDGAGVEEMLAAVQAAVTEGSSVLEHNGVIQEFRLQPGAADIDMEPTRIVWRLDAAKVTEIAEYLETLRTPDPRSVLSGHQYVDLVRPIETLILSRDEYVDVVFPWEQPGSNGTVPSDP